MDSSQRYCVIGAGPCGLVAAKTLREAGFHVDLFDRADDVGGNWYYGQPASSVYQSASMISSKRMSEFSDFPMPKQYPPYPSHQQALEYLRGYARHFGIYELARFNTSVVRVEPVADAPDSAWRVILDSGEVLTYRGVVIASGHHSQPRMPELPGEFAGELLHAHDYKTPDVLRGKRVLVVGGGNSGCDIAVEASRHATSTLLSLRRGYHFLPKFLLGGPLDSGGERFERWHLPYFLRRWITSFLVYVAHGRPERYGLPRPMHQLFATHPIVNSQLLYCVGHGAIGVRSGIEKVKGNTVRFSDGKEDVVDLMICATGYQATLPMLDEGLVYDNRNQPALFLNCFHKHYDHLFVTGLIQPNGAIWPLAELQAKLMAAFLRAKTETPTDAAWFRQQKLRCRPNLAAGMHYDESERHRLEVEFHAYRRTVRKLLATVSRRLPSRNRFIDQVPASANSGRPLPSEVASATLR
jgi:hypothetical protein